MGLPILRRPLENFSCVTIQHLLKRIARVGDLHGRQENEGPTVAESLVKSLTHVQPTTLAREKSVSPTRDRFERCWSFRVRAIEIIFKASDRSERIAY